MNLLKTELAKKLYQEIKDLPIIDYHNHLDPKEIYENKPFQNIVDMWLKYDHYKWRKMRYFGYDSHQGSKEEKFVHYIESIELEVGSPLYHWSQLELKMFFDIDEELKKKNAPIIYNQANAFLEKHPLRPQDILRKCNVKKLYTTDDLMSDLEYHKFLQEDESIPVKVYPTFRPDRLFYSFHEVLYELEEKYHEKIKTIDNLMKFLEYRVKHFDNHGSKLADHGITRFEYSQITKDEANKILRRIIEKEYSKSDMKLLEGYILQQFLVLYKKYGMTVQYHLGALRDTNTVMFNILGKDSGYDSISGFNYTDNLTTFFNHTRKLTKLPNLVIYPLNPNHYQELAIMCGTFSETKGQFQLGAAWWFNDHLQGIEQHFDILLNYLSFSEFIGMLTDSRSFLSMSRHYYFRQILCEYIGQKVQKGIMPNNYSQLKQIVKKIVYQNISRFLNQEM
jgi:glucuronate isomerase